MYYFKILINNCIYNVEEGERRAECRETLNQEDLMGEPRQESQFRVMREMDRGPVINVQATLRSLEVDEN
jgi:hypothetical protein